MSVNKLSTARVAVGSLLVGSAPGKKNAPFATSPVEIAGIRLATSGTITPGTIAAASVYTTTVTYAGVGTSDAVVVIPPAGLVASVDFCAYVSAANTITLRVSNPTAGGIAVVAAAWNFLVLQLSPDN